VLHPTLVALSIVLELNEDLRRITRSHPGQERHAFYNVDFKFPKDISNLLPQPADWWWEHLGRL